MDMTRVMEGIYTRLLRGETVPVKSEFLSSVIAMLERKGHSAVITTQRDDERTDVQLSDLEWKYDEK